jgi:hypothetical protein
MLWFDNDKNSTPEEKILRVAQYCKEKYNADPNVCYVHHPMYTELDKRCETPKIQVGDIEIKTSSNILLHHFWIGVEEKHEIPM